MRRVVLWCLAGYLLIVLVMMLLERSLIFLPAPYPEGDWQPATFAFEDAWFQADDGTRLHGWYVPHESPRAVVLYCHGNAGNITHRSPIVQVLHDEVGVSLLIFDYRGYGRSQGRPDEPGILADARAARHWLAKREGIAPERVVLMGRSLGGAVAVDLAAKDGAGALVLESTFTSLPNVAAYHYPWLPVRRLMRTRLDSVAKIRDYHGPLLQSHGPADTIIPFAEGRRLFEMANEPKQFFSIVGRDHNDTLPDEYYRALTEFLERSR